MKRMKTVLLFSVVLLMLVAPLTYGQTTSPGAKGPLAAGDEWQFRVTPYVWAPQVESKVTVGGYSATVNAYFSDIMRHLNGAGMADFEVRKGKLGFFFNPLYLKLRGDGTFTGTSEPGLAAPPTRDITLTLTTWIVEFGGFYQAAKWPLDSKGGRSVTLDVLAGGRYWSLRADLDTSSPINPTGNEDFVDPIIGARTRIDLTDKLAFNLEGDIGGFGVGSDFTWSGQGGFSYQFTPLISASIGYRALYVDYKAGTSAVRYHETIQGPTTGITFKF